MFFLNLWKAFQIDSNEGLFQSVEILIFVWTGVFGLDAQVAKCWKMLKDVERCWKSRKKFAADLECEIFWDPGTRSRPNRCKALSARSGCELRDGSNLECLKRFDSIVYLDEMNLDPDESSRTI